MKLKKWTSLALIVLFGIGQGFLIAEIVLRIFPTSLPPEIHPQIAQKPWLVSTIGLPQFFAEYRVVWEADDLLREHIRPNIDTTIHGNPEYPVWPIKTSDLGLGPAGFRDTLPQQSPYALVLGDSFGFGVGVNQQNNWVDQLETTLGQPIINLSQVGASSLQEARIYEHYGHQFPVKVVIWLFFQNDMKENLRFLQWLEPDQEIPQAVHQMPNTCTTLIHKGLKRYSLAYELITYWSRTCDYASLLRTPTYQTDTLSLVFCLDHDICDPDVQTKMLQHGWPLAKQAILDTQAQVQATGAEFVIVIVPSKEQIYREAFQQVSDAPSTQNVDQLVEPLRTLCQVEELYCLDLTLPLREQVKEDQQLYFPVDIHWNEAGNQAVANALATYLREVGLFP